ncbi:MAG: signal peptidase I [Blautia massiliensis (ex Durand et al. 2017)]
MKTVKKIWNIVTTLIVALIVVLAVVLVGSRLMGMRVFSVLSGSMEPNYPTGSLIFVREVDPLTLGEGDVITFMLDEDTVATHRIVGVVPDEDDPSVIRFQTKGDANDAPDGGLVHYKNVIGSPVFCVPKLGYLMNYIQHPPGTYVAIAVFAVLLLLMLLPDLIFSGKAAEKEEGGKTAPKGKDAPPPETQRPDAPPAPPGGRRVHTARAAKHDPPQ